MFGQLRNLTQNTEKNTPEKEHNYDVKQFLKHPRVSVYFLMSGWHSYYSLQQSINSRRVLDKLLDEINHCLLFTVFPF